MPRKIPPANASAVARMLLVKIANASPPDATALMSPGSKWCDTSGRSPAGISPNAPGIVDRPQQPRRHRPEQEHAAGQQLPPQRRDLRPVAPEQNARTRPARRAGRAYSAARAEHHQPLQPRHHRVAGKPPPRIRQVR